ncbi:MAG: Re/Si-specific NAD(P)(+) transhydrogenase subunit alpha [Myxococcales bacterium]|nr:Re/Si-specific NAD(P)(+) transhydrogenase subunit alpha [Myxococcales bacterium]
MRIAIPREVRPAERRVAATPATVKKLISFGFSVDVQTGAGHRADYPDEDYTAAGATLRDDVKALWSDADLVLKVEPPVAHPDLDAHEASFLKEGATLASFVQADLNPDVIDQVKARNATLIAMEKVPRITRAQKMDALSSMANIAGYRAVVEAANVYGSFFTGQITAAGKVPPARVLIIGAGVAGLAAVGAARGLGAEVRAFDTRSAVREQVQSMGARFLEVEIEEEGETKGGYAKVMSQAFIDAEMDLFREQAKEIDIVITTALIPGRPAPKLWLADMVELMKPGSVVVDLAAQRGGNCELTVPGEHVINNDVHIIGYTDLASRMPRTASQLYGTNLVHLLDDLSTDGTLELDPLDDVVRGAVMVHNGADPSWPDKPEKPKKAAKPAPQPKTASAESKAATPAKAPAKAAVGHGSHPTDEGAGGKLGVWIATAAIAGLFVVWAAIRGGSDGASTTAGSEFVQHLTVFVLACVVGWHVVWNVTPALHTPLMSVTNAISGIIVLGGILQLVSEGTFGLAGWLGIAAVTLATINIAGGFLVTERMLRMFRK